MIYIVWLSGRLGTVGQYIRAWTLLVYNWCDDTATLCCLFQRGESNADVLLSKLRSLLQNLV